MTLFLLAAVLALGSAGSGASSASPAPPPARIVPNDNRRSPGAVAHGVLRVTIEARVGRWYPDSDRRRHPLVVAAFAVQGQTPTIPGPMLRVETGTRIHVRLVNRLPGLPLIVRGLQSHPASGEDSVRLAPGAAREVEFAAGEPGTYFYWGATSDTATMENRVGLDSQLSGALIVDPAGGPVVPDRVFVLGLFDFPAESTGGRHLPERFGTAINGRSWPYAERFDPAVGDTLHWRWINPTADNHPMHLHGFYYRVDARGTVVSDTLYQPDRRRMVVTERVDPGTTMAMTWSPDRQGQWLLHCHIHGHISPDSSWDFKPLGAGAGHLGSWDMGNEMSGLILGIRVRARGDEAPTVGPPATRVRLALGPMLVRPDGSQIRIEATSNGAPSTDLRTPGPPIVLHRGEPAEVVVVNLLDQPTVIHWHGIELESYFDGVAGWSGEPGRLAPLIAPGDSFVARITPPRSGTFIYHAHYLSSLQVGDGLIGPLLVLEPGEAIDPTGEVVWIIGGRDIFETGRLLINGMSRPPALHLEAGRRYRVRIINITEGNTGDLALLEGDRPVEWRLLAKDAIPVSGARSLPGPARVRTSVGETWDFEWTPGRSADLLLEVRNDEALMAEQRIEVR